ncbi:hypothetical protein KRX19_01625 [Cardiobacteriaceae bacterium TAE3-ERU3]|nr:hypothetical protein [Cardiobacteriaceae bacterium TAE3-ERU3]
MENEYTQLTLTMWLVDGERILGLSEEYGDTLYYTEVTKENMPKTIEAAYIEAAQ